MPALRGIKFSCICRPGFMINIIINGHHNIERQSWHIVQNLLQQIQSWIWLCVTITGIQKHADSEYKTLVFSLTFSYCLIIGFFVSFISIFGIEPFLLKSKIEKKYGRFFMSNYGTVNHKQPNKDSEQTNKTVRKKTWFHIYLYHVCTHMYHYVYSLTI